jgi:16S rRNA (adenine1518-N6/adenine1519-N6)-dimethyltransferase
MSLPIRPKKSLGQHFLRDDSVHEEILHWTRLDAGDRVLEIGAGDGTLTRSLAARAGKVLAVETDRRCLRLLRKEFPPGGRVDVVETDILDFDLFSLEGLAPLKVVGDLPYNIATAVLDRLLAAGRLFPLMILMFQKEVALRLTAQEGTKDYGSLTLATAYRAETEIIRVVPPQAFVPPPKVDSALVRVLPRTAPLLPARAERTFHRLVRAGFRQRRKTFLNSLQGSGSPVAVEVVAAALERLSLPAKVRAEKISFTQFLRLAEILAGNPRGEEE